MTSPRVMRVSTFLVAYEWLTRCFLLREELRKFVGPMSQIFLNAIEGDEAKFYYIFSAFCVSTGSGEFYYLY